MKDFKYYIISVFFLLSNEVKSQLHETTMKRNALVLEAGGAGGYGSLNYERRIPFKEKLSFAASIGLSTYNIFDYTAQINPDIITPISIKGFIGKKHKLVFGFGKVITSLVQADYISKEPSRELKAYSNFTIGYRYQKVSGGLFFGLNYTPIILFNGTYLNWAGISIGFGF